MFAPTLQSQYIAATQELQRLSTLPMVAVSDFTAATGRLITSLTQLGLHPEQLQVVSDITLETVQASQGQPIFRVAYVHYLNDLYKKKIYPQSRKEDPATTFARLQQLIEGRVALSAPQISSRRETHYADTPSPPPATAALLKDVDLARRNQATAASTLMSPGGGAAAVAAAVPPTTLDDGNRPSISLQSVEPATRRLVVLEQQAHSEQYVAVQSQYRLYPNPIGEGASGKVYAGVDGDTGQKVAIKVVTIPDASRRAECIDRFQKERRFQGGIESDEIVRIFKTGLTGQGEPYLAMELLTGGTLMDYIESLHSTQPRSRRFNLAEIHHFAAMAISGVCAAHRGGILHLDIKPENCLFSSDKRKLKWGDFGISERIEEAGVSGNGTLGYMPLETFQGERDGVQRDIFALGVVLYLLYTGRLPYHDDSVGRFIDDMRTRTPESPRHIRPDLQIPEDIDRIIMKAISLDRNVRYRTAEDLLLDFVSSDVRLKVENANGVLSEDSDGNNDPDVLGRQKVWMLKMREAIRKLEAIEEKYPSDRLRQWRLQLVQSVHDHADITGDIPLLRETTDMIADLDADDERIEPGRNQVTTHLNIDDPHGLLRRGHFEIHMARFEDRAGVFRIKDMTSLPQILRSFESGRDEIAGIGITGLGIAPVFVPLPVRPGQHRVRIPVYALNEVPENFVIVPGGTVQARNRYGSYAERPEISDTRFVDHDFAIGNLATSGDYWRFLSQFGDSDEVHHRKPSHWQFTETNILGPDGRPIHLDEPIQSIGFDDINAFLLLMHPGCRLPTLNEMKRAARGNDSRIFPWGDAEAKKPSMAAFQYNGFPPAASPVPSVPTNPHFADRSPFSVPSKDRRTFERAAYHFAGNLKQVISLGVTPEDRRAILNAFAVSRGVDPTDERVNNLFMVTVGNFYNGPAPVDTGIIGLESIPEVSPDGMGKVRYHYGFRPVKPLRSIVG